MQLFYHKRKEKKMINKMTIKRRHNKPFSFMKKYIWKAKNSTKNNSGKWIIFLSKLRIADSIFEALLNLC